MISRLQQCRSGRTAFSLPPVHAMQPSHATQVHGPNQGGCKWRVCLNQATFSWNSKRRVLDFSQANASCKARDVARSSTSNAAAARLYLPRNFPHSAPYHSLQWPLPWDGRVVLTIIKLMRHSYNIHGGRYRARSLQFGLFSSAADSCGVFDAAPQGIR
jgi:hypothetical protein